MSRPLRIEFAGALYHVTSRGDGREDIYRCDADRLTWLDLFATVCARFDWVCYAWCQMDNHYHVVLETQEANLSSGMRQLNGVYTQAFNRRHHRSGHVFQGRFHAILVERDAYLLELVRYVVLNPVRARMATDASAWPWSSYSAMVGAHSVPRWLGANSILRQFGLTRRRAVAAFVEFIQAGVSTPSIWSGLRAQLYLGREAFVEGLERPADCAAHPEIPRAQRRPHPRPIESYRLVHDDRSAAMAAAFASGDYSMQQIARVFGVHYATVSRAVKARTKMAASSRMRPEMLECKT